VIIVVWIGENKIRVVMMRERREIHELYAAGTSKTRELAHPTRKNITGSHGSEEEAFAPVLPAHGESGSND
jgi:hypothetical protein